jgi:hypothetical protein
MATWQCLVVVAFFFFEVFFFATTFAVAALAVDVEPDEKIAELLMALVARAPTTTPTARYDKDVRFIVRSPDQV